MAINTSNIDLVKPGIDEFYDVNVMNSNLDKIDAFSGDIINKINNGATHSPTLNWGMNNKIQIPEVSTPITLDFEGFSITNLLGSDGNCEDISKWNGFQGTLSSDPNNKVFGNNGIKIVSNNTQGAAVNMISKYNIDITKYYLFSAYAKNGNANLGIQIIKDASGGGVQKSSPLVTITTKFTRVCVRLQPSDFNSGNFIGVYITGVAGQYAYVDGIMFNEIAAEEYSLSDDDLMKKYPYVDSHACLVNPMFENRRHNLVINGNGECGMVYWKSSTPNTFPGRVDGKFRISNGAQSGNLYQLVPVKKNTNYYISANLYDVSAIAAISIMTTNLLTHIRPNTLGTFNTGDNDMIAVVLHTGGAGVADFDSIMLIEGTTAPTEYVSCDLQRFVVEGRFEKGDKVHIENKVVSGSRISKYRVLFGKDYDWQFHSAYSDYKTLTIPTGVLPDIYTPSSEKRNVLGKYNGDIVPRLDTIGAGNNGWALNDTYFYLNIPNTESGFMESVNPNGDEVKAILNGWKAVNNNGTRYYAWVSVVDNSIPLPVTTATGTNVIGQNKLNVVDGTKFAVNDFIYFVSDSAGPAFYQITTITGNQLTLNVNLIGNASTNNPISKYDTSVATESLKVLNYCKANVAPGYTGHKFTYYVNYVRPEPISDVNMHIHSEIWDLVKGDNHVRIEPGIVLDEIATVVSIGTTYYINRNPPVGDPNPVSSQLKNQVEQFLGQYRNGVYDSSWAVDGIVPYGKVRLTTSQANIIPGATYTVDYQMLKTLHAQSFGSLSLSYRQSIINSLNGLSRVVEEKQSRDSLFNLMLDASVYEIVSFGWLNAYYVHNGPYGIVISFLIPCSTKRIGNYSIKILNMTFMSGGSGSVIECTNAMKFETPNANRTHVLLHYSVTDATVIANIKNYGLQISGRMILDCRGRV